MNRVLDLKRIGIVLLLTAVLLSPFRDGVALGFVLSVEITSLSATVGGSETITINDGTAPYSAASNNESVATVRVEGNVVTWTGVSEGTASITIGDSDSNSVIAAVTVAGTAPPEDVELSMTEGTALTLSISAGDGRSVPIIDGTGFYRVTASSEDVAVVRVEGNTLIITALGEGTTTITIEDSALNAATVELTVNNVVTVSPKTLTLAVGESANLIVTNGTGYYKVASSDTDVAQASFTTGGSVIVSGAAEGEAVVTVTDSSGGTATSTVTVVAEVGGFSFVVGSGTAVSTSATIFEGQEDTIGLRDGSGFYDVATSDEAVATGSIRVDTGGEMLVITALLAGEAILTVTDSRGEVVVVNVTVKPVLSASVEVLKVQTGTRASFTVDNTSNFINVVTSNRSVATALWSEGTVTVTGVSPGTALITVSENEVSVDSVEVTVVALFPPVMTVAVTDLDVTLSWTEVDGATGYRLSGVAALDRPDTLVTADLRNSTSATFKLFSGFDYIIALQAYNDEGESGYSNAENIIIP